MCRKRFHGFFLPKRGLEIWGCSFVLEMKLKSTSSAEQILSDEITWIWNEVKSEDMAVLEIRFSVGASEKWFGIRSCSRRESCHTHEWVMSHIWLSHVTHTQISPIATMSHTWMSHVTHMRESCHIYTWVMSHIGYTCMNEWCHAYTHVCHTHTHMYVSYSH